MSKNMADVGTRLSAIAIAQEESRLNAVKLERKGEVFELLWTKSGEVSNGDWGSTGVGYYRIGLPLAKQEDMPAMVRLQAETLLPLPAEKMQMTWRAGQMQNGEVPITIAAARNEPLQTFLENVRCFEPTNILLESEAVVKAWTVLFSGNSRDAAVVSLAARNTQVCLAEAGRLSNAAVLDIGTQDFARTAQNPLLSADQKLMEQTVTTERFTQDMRSVLESFGCVEPAALPVFVLSDGSSVIESIISCLSSAGLNATAALPDLRRLRGQTELGIEEAYKYRVPIGLALMALDDVGELNIFERLYNPAAAKEKKSVLYSPKVAAIIAGIMLAALAVVSFVLDVRSEKHLRQLQAQAGFREFVERQSLIKTVARQRPDLLGLLNEISSGEGKGILLDSFHFKKGQPVTIAGQVQSADQLYKFQESLLSKKGIQDVNIQSAAPDSKTKKIKFTMTFHYKTFTKKSSRM